MSTIKKFQDIEAWQKARELSKEIYEITYSTELSKDFALKDQIRRSSGSVMDNIAEGFERDGRKEFIYQLQRDHVVKLLVNFIESSTRTTSRKISLSGF